MICRTGPVVNTKYGFQGVSGVWDYKFPRKSVPI